MMTTYKLSKYNTIIKDGLYIPSDPKNADYVEYLAWVEAGNTPLPADPEPTPEPEAATINPDPEKALDEAIAEMEKGQGADKSIALIALSLAKYLKSKRDKLK